MTNRLVNRAKLLKTMTSLLAVLGVSSFIPLPAFSQSARPRYDVVQNATSNPTSRVIPFQGRGNGISGVVKYPYGSRVNTGGVVTTPNGNVISPSVRVNNGDGSITYYYPDGSRINTNGTTIRPTGIPITR